MAITQWVPTAFAKTPQRVKSHPCAIPARNPAQKASPAPVVSTAFTDRQVGTCCRGPPAGHSSAPVLPVLTTTLFGPISSSRSAIRSGSVSPVSFAASSTLGINRSRCGSAAFTFGSHTS